MWRWWARRGGWFLWQLGWLVVASGCVSWLEPYGEEWVEFKCVFVNGVAHCCVVDRMNIGGFPMGCD